MNLLYFTLAGGFVALLSYEWVRTYLLRAGRWRAEQTRARRRLIRYARGIFSPCPCCGKEAAGHQLHDLISVAQPLKDHAAQIDRAVRDHAWRSLKPMYGSEASSEALGYWLLECPNQKRGVLYRVESRSDFYESDEVQAVEVLDHEGTAELLSDLQRGPPMAL